MVVSRCFLLFSGVQCAILPISARECADICIVYFTFCFKYFLILTKKVPAEGWICCISWRWSPFTRPEIFPEWVFSPRLEGGTGTSLWRQFFFGLSVPGRLPFPRALPCPYCQPDQEFLCVLFGKGAFPGSFGCCGRVYRFRSTGPNLHFHRAVRLHDPGHRGLRRDFRASGSACTPGDDHGAAL